MDVAICKENNEERERERGRPTRRKRSRTVAPCGFVAYGRLVVASSLNIQAPIMGNWGGFGGLTAAFLSK